MAADAAEATGREMIIHDVDLSIWTVDDRGIVQVSLTWDGLEAVKVDRIVITEPFASGFDTERRIRYLGSNTSARSRNRTVGLFYFLTLQFETAFPAVKTELSFIQPHLFATKRSFLATAFQSVHLSKNIK